MQQDNDAFSSLSLLHIIQREEVEHELAGGKTTSSPCHVGTMNGVSDDGIGEPEAASLVSLVSMSTRHIGHRLLEDNHWSIHSM